MKPAASPSKSSSFRIVFSSSLWLLAYPALRLERNWVGASQMQAADLEYPPVAAVEERPEIFPHPIPPGFNQVDSWSFRWLNVYVVEGSYPALPPGWKTVSVPIAGKMLVP